MFRISRVDGRSRTVVTIDGYISGEYVQVAERCCEQAISIGKCVHVFLRGVLEVDEGGRDLLRRLAASGCRLHASGVYISYIVRTLRSAGVKKANTPGARRPAAGKTQRSR